MTSILGYPNTTPVAIIEKATTNDQRILLGTLKNISSIAIEQQAKAPATIIIGEVVNVLKDNNDFQNFETKLPNFEIELLNNRKEYNKLQSLNM
jgi:siroheme synthase